ncbi:hypothetical protein MLD38_019534 [Melastoma candidum]|uniref:Uncharacterized protein n=1 Tax=Melastoma candidum TaxID=119954 RepID=A0ACB9QXH7_9MYRT|nr:hypothetical protein MLD38_019534 [Melastoma candidum]
MAPIGGDCGEDNEPTTVVTDRGTTITRAEVSSIQTKSAVRVARDHAIPSGRGMHKLLKCPVCTSLMYAPIYQCVNGHTLCSGCKTTAQNQCPVCQHHLGDIRCLALEKLVQNMELPCRYQNSGCPEILQYQNQPDHDQHCRFRPYECPYAGSVCSFTGDIPTLVSHLKEHHKVDMHDGCTFNHRYVKANAEEVDNATWMLTVFNCFGRQFCLHFEAFQLGLAPVYMAFLRFMGEDEEAKKFGYSLEVGGNGRKLIWKGIPRSIRDSHRKVRDSMDGLLIQRNLALYFSGENKRDRELKLRVSGHIWKEE